MMSLNNKKYNNVDLMKHKSPLISFAQELKASKNLCEIWSVRREFIPATNHQHSPFVGTIFIQIAEIWSATLHRHKFHKRVRIFHLRIRRNSCCHFPQYDSIRVHICF